MVGIISLIRARSLFHIEGGNASIKPISTHHIGESLSLGHGLMTGKHYSPRNWTSSYSCAGPRNNFNGSLGGGNPFACQGSISAWRVGGVHKTYVRSSHDFALRSGEREMAKLKARAGGRRRFNAKCAKYKGTVRWTGSSPSRSNPPPTSPTSPTCKNQPTSLKFLPAAVCVVR